jgi:polysaccharide export outer membrane protein
MKLVIVFVLLFAVPVFPQVSRTVPILPPVAQTHDPSAEFSLNHPSDAPTSTEGNDIRLGHDDLVEVSVFEIPELSAIARVTAAGTVVLPYVGLIEAARKTPQELAKTIEDALRAKYVNDPHVTVFVREYASQPVSIIGAVKMPGIYQIKGQKSLLDVLAMAQGLNENAGKEIHVMRRKSLGGESALDAVTKGSVQGQPGDGVVVKSDPHLETATIVIDSVDLFRNGNAALNIPIHAGDVVNVLNAGSIFVVGELQRPGESILHYGRSVTVTQAIALGGGLTKDAKKTQAFIIRPHADGTKEQIPLNIAKVLDGSHADPLLLANDVLFVPSNKVKAGASKALDTAITIVIGRAIYQGF